MSGRSQGSRANARWPDQCRRLSETRYFPWIVASTARLVAICMSLIVEGSGPYRIQAGPETFGGATCSPPGVVCWATASECIKRPEDDEVTAPNLDRQGGKRDKPRSEDYGIEINHSGHST